jgi:Mg/Co/Ni transporter MgtE
MDPQQQQAEESQFNVFVNTLIDQKFADHKAELTDEVREELKKDIAKRLDEFVMARIIAALSDEDVKQLENLLKEDKSQAELQKFATEHIPDFTTFLTNAFLEFQSVYLGK